jgi:hypothetical protein
MKEILFPCLVIISCFIFLFITMELICKSRQVHLYFKMS